MLTALHKAGAQLNRQTCKFGFPSVTYLGHVVSKEGVFPTDDKIQAVRDFPTPKTVRNVREFLGLTGYYRKFIRGYAQKAEDLNVLLRKDLPFSWARSSSQLLTI